MSKTVRMICLLQEDSLPRQQIKHIEKAMRQLYARTFGDKRFAVFWLLMPKGQSYMAAQPSSANTVMLPVPNDLSTPRRHAFMKEFCDIWMEITGCRSDQILISAPDQRYADSYMTAASSRFHPAAQFRAQMSLLLRFAVSKLVRGYARASANFPTLAR